MDFIVPGPIGIHREYRADEQVAMPVGRAIDDIVGHNDPVHVGMKCKLDQVGESTAIPVDAEDGSMRVGGAGKG